MEKVYVVKNSWCNDCCGDMEKIYVFKTYESAKNKFEEIKKNIQSFELGYDYIEDEKDFYCESIEGEYLYNHELVSVEEYVLNQQKGVYDGKGDF